MRYGWIALFWLAAVLVSVDAPMRAQELAATPVTFTRDILPILQKNCQTCHRPGQIAPMSLLTYEQVRPWARSIKAKVVSRQMPPWFADPQYGTFANDRSLEQKDIDRIAAWVDAGAPPGDPKDAPPARAWSDDGWQIEPDIVVRGSEFRVPARPPKNVIEWTSVLIPSGFTKDTWITSVEIKPSDLAVTHHICFSFVPHRDDAKYYVMNWTESPRDEEGVAIDKGATARWAGTAGGGANTSGVGRAPGPVAAGNGGFSCYVPGVQADDYRPFNAAKLVPANSDISLQLHYTPTGKEVVDRPLIGFTVAPEPPEKRWISYAISGAGPGFLIPPYEGNYKSPPADAEFTADAWLVQMMPHMHLRGKTMTYELTFPDGRKQTVLNVPKYDFNWQIVYQPRTPIFIPKGTTIHIDATFDNSTANKFNPNPGQAVYPGRMTWEEMMSPFFGVIVDSKTDVNSILKLRGQTVITTGA